ncbi:DUF4097 family beta strand repeat-containing protein [Silvibacterium acidisoli]|uniref:DUF4097 family beta strand repeat-containing protein n=1 Tax=Acidobacteriaceae bacterium ZG23-2 TaxID=2883246 RepID=UPI00406C77ED
MGMPPYPPRDAERQAREYARAQARAAQEQARAQRRYWSYQRQLRQRGSVARPLLLISVGVVAFLLETGKLSSSAFWTWYSRWWPVVLIAIGLILLLEYFLDRRDPYSGQRGAGGVVFFIVLLAFLGWGAHTAHRWAPFSNQFGSDGDDFFSMLGEEHTNDLDVNTTLNAGATVDIQNPRGDVTVNPSDDGSMHVHAHQIVHADSEKKAQKVFDQIRPQINASGNSGSVIVPGRDGVRVDLIVNVPAKSFARINAGHGDVTVNGVANNVDVTSNHGDVKFDNVGGDVHARMNHGDFSAHQVTGNATVDGHVDDVTLSEVKGQATLNGEFFGDTHLEQIGSNVHFQTTRTNLDIPRLSGELTMDSDDLDANQMAGPVRIVTRSKNIKLSDVSGDVHIENSDGDVSIRAVSPLGNIQVANKTGGVTVSLPDNAEFSVNANTTQDDDLETDFPLQSATTNGRHTLTGTIGKGTVTLNLQTTHGNIELRKGGSSAPPEPPKPPQAPKTPEPPKHLKVPKVPPVPPVEQ